jgi:hypothetical protein
VKCVADEIQYSLLMEHAKTLARLLDEARRMPGSAVNMKWEMESREAVRDFEAFVEQ